MLKSQNLSFIRKVSSLAEDGDACIVKVFYVPGGDVERITEAVSWDSLLLAGFWSQVPLRFKGEEKQGSLDSMGLFVGAARLNPCHSLTDQLGCAESPVGVSKHCGQLASQDSQILRHASQGFTSADLHCLLALSPRVSLWLSALHET